jgi:molybdopterin molybdotransferase
MLTLEEARALLLAELPAPETQVVPLIDAAHRVLAHEVVARAPLPAFDHSSMDGYALVASDLVGDPPWALSVSGESVAGRKTPPLSPRSAQRIFTGAPLPHGADTVVPQEHVARTGDGITLTRMPQAGQFVRRVGEDLPAGARALAVGTRLSAGAIALAAMLDQAELVVARRPRVTLLCTGSELRPPGTTGGTASIPESNSAALASLARQAGAAVHVLPLVRDDASAIEAAVAAALSADVLVTLGGVSVGDYDFVRPALERAGVAIDGWRVAIKPGKPIVLGRRGTTRVLGLPGNPASALVTFTLFGIPLLRALQGDAHPLGMLLSVRLSTARLRSPDRLELARARLEMRDGTLWATTDANQASGAATSLATSDGIAFVPPGVGAVEAGGQVDFLRWSDA